MPERITPKTLGETGENVVAIATALDRADVTRRTPWGATFFDIGGVAALSYSMVVGWVIAATSLLFGVMAMVRVTAAAVRTGGGWRWVLTAIWSALGLALAAAAMVGATWALRAAREVYHPWYARPDRLFLLLLAVGTTAAWAMSRAGRWLPPRARGMRHPVGHVEPHAAAVDGDGGGGDCGSRPARHFCGRCRCSPPAILLMLTPLGKRSRAPNHLDRRAGRDGNALAARYGGAPAFHGGGLRPAADRDAGAPCTPA